MKYCDISQDEMELVYHRTNEHIKELRKIYSDGKCTDCENYNNCEYLPEYDKDGNCLHLSEERAGEWKYGEIDWFKLGESFEEGFRKGLERD